MNARQRAIRFTSIKENGCICCKMDDHSWTYPDVHHQLTTGFHGNGKRLGDEFTVGLCRWHHTGNRDESCWWAEGPSYALEAKAFREKYGSDEVLLAFQNKVLDATAPMLGGVR